MSACKNAARLDFVVCTFNNRQIVAPTLAGIAAQTMRDFTCTVVDNCSSDGTPEFVEERFPWAKVVRKPANNGPADSRNRGWECGRAEYVAFLDSDVILEPDWAEQQIRLLESNRDIGIACGKLLYGSAPGILYGVYGVMNRYGIAWDGGVREPATRFLEARRCLWANTTAIMTRRCLTERMGGFDSDMFTMFEDVDFGWRANLFGYLVMYNPAAVAVHRTHGTIDPRLMTGRLVYLSWRNRLRSVLINYEAPNLVRYAAPLVAMSLADAVFRGFVLEKLSALWWNVKSLRGTLRRRRFVQRHRTVRDRELWHMFERRLRGPGYFALAAGTEAALPVPAESSAPR